MWASPPRDLQPVRLPCVWLLPTGTPLIAPLGTATLATGVVDASTDSTASAVTLSAAAAAPTIFASK